MTGKPASSEQLPPAVLAMLAVVVVVLLAGGWRSLTGARQGAVAVPQAPVATPYDLDTLIAAADPDRGRAVFGQCRGCHGLSADDTGVHGPTLFQIVGRKPAAVAGFRYSDELRAETAEWTPARLDAWLRDPKFLPRNRMRFSPVADPVDRAALLKYLMEMTTQ